MLAQDGEDLAVRLINLFSCLGAGQHNFAAREDQQHHLRVCHPENQSWEQLRIVPTVKLVVRRFQMQRLKLDSETNVMGSDNVLHSEVSEMDARIIDFLELSRIVFGCRVTVLLRLGPSADHFTRSEDQCCRLRFSDTHDGCCESLRLVLYILALQTDFVKIKLASQFGRGHDVL